MKNGCFGRNWRNKRKTIHYYESKHLAGVALFTRSILGIGNLTYIELTNLDFIMMSTVPTFQMQRSSFYQYCEKARLGVIHLRSQCTNVVAG